MKKKTTTEKKTKKTNTESGTIHKMSKLFKVMMLQAVGGEC